MSSQIHLEERKFNNSTVDLRKINILRRHKIRNTSEYIMKRDCTAAILFRNSTQAAKKQSNIRTIRFDGVRWYWYRDMSNPGHGRLFSDVDIDDNQEYVQSIYDKYKDFVMEPQVAEVAMNNVLDYMKSVFPFEYRMLTKVKIMDLSSKKDLTACAYYDKNIRKFVIEYNPTFVRVMADLIYVTRNYMRRGLTSLNDYEIALLYLLSHELEHIIRAHVVIDKKYENMELANLCFDMMINNSLRYILSPDYPFEEVNVGCGINSAFKIKGIAKKTVSYKTIVSKLSSYVGTIPAGSTITGSVSKGEELEMIIACTSTTNEFKWYDGVYDIMNSYFEMPEVCGSGFDSIYNSESGSSSMPADKESSVAINKIIDEAMSQMTLEEKKANTSDKYGQGLASIVASVDRGYTGKAKDEQTWRKVLRNYVRKGLSTEEVYKINSPNARIEGQFGRDEDVPTIKQITFAIDVSGSMGIEDYKWCLDEVDAAMKSIKARVKVRIIWWGSSYQIEEFPTYQKFKERCKKACPSLGGTYVDLAVRELNKKRSDVQIIMTDGMFTKPLEQLKAETLWAITPQGTTRAVPDYNSVVVLGENK